MQARILREIANYQLYLEVKARFEAITLPKTVIDTDCDLESCIEQAPSRSRLIALSLYPQHVPQWYTVIVNDCPLA